MGLCQNDLLPYVPRAFRHPVLAKMGMLCRFDPQLGLLHWQAYTEYISDGAQTGPKLGKSIAEP